WAAPEPFLYFTDHNEELGRLVTEGRRKEFSGFSAVADAGNHATIPDPQKPETFLQSKLDWTVLKNGDHAKCLRWYRTLLHLRTQLLESAEFDSARALNERLIEVSWKSASEKFHAVIALEGPTAANDLSWRGKTVVLSSEENRYI